MKIAVILIRSSINISHPVQRTLDILGLKFKNNCAVVEGTPQTQGMIDKIKDITTWGPVDDATLKAMAPRKKSKDSNVYALNPPRKGFGRKGIKVAFINKGALGDRKEKINDLLMRML